MNNRFKMRAWDENNKIMHYDFQFIKSGDDGNDWIIFQSDEQKLDFDKEKNFCINVYPNPYFAQQNNKIIKIWSSQREAYKKLNLCQSMLSGALTGKFKTAYGFEWKYIYENKELLNENS